MNKLMNPQQMQSQQPMMAQGMQAQPAAPTNFLARAAQPPEQNAQGKPFNGSVTVNGKKVEVEDGIATMGEKKFFVSTDGSVVIDQNRNVVGSVENGKFVPTTEQHIAELKKRGIVQ
jgi:hypothetical protein